MLFIGLIVTIISFVLIPDMWIYGVGSSPGISGTAFFVALVLGLWYMRNSFIVLGPEGITLSVLNPIYETFNLIEFLFLIIITLMIWFFFSSFLFLSLRKFLVISSSGVYYRQIIRKGLFSWNEVSKIEGITKESYPDVAKLFGLVKIFLLNGKKIKFASNWYKNKEFFKKVYVEMFFNLFDINLKLSKSY